jgi:ATP-binding cassette subfamily F protein 3
VLLEALAVFSGTVVFVSHDRYFIDRLATRVLEVEGGTVTSHEGNYEDYLRWKAAQAAGGSATESAAREAETARVSPAKENAVANDDDAEAVAAKDRPRRLNPIKQKQMEERCAFLEEEVPRIEAAIAHTEQQLAVYVSAEETQRLTILASELREQLTMLTAEWEELMLQLDGQETIS